MKYLFLLLALIPFFALAEGGVQEAAQSVSVEVPVMSFSQQVEIVFNAKKSANVYDLKIAQSNENIRMDAIVDKIMNRSDAKLIATNLIMLAKSKSLDDKPKEKDKPGKGLYNYRVSIIRPDGVVLVNALKPREKEAVEFENPFLAQPLTRADVNGR